MRSGIEGVKRYYDLLAREEDERLFRDHYHELEFLVTMHYLKKYLPPRGKVLDCGAGSGTYSIELARMGYEVALVDISDVLLEMARSKFQKGGLENKLLGIFEAPSMDLSAFAEGSFDAVLCFGPLYHLVEQRDRAKTVMEMKRVLKKGGRLFVSAISLFGVFGAVLIGHPEELVDEKHREMFETGVHRGEWHEQPATFPDAYFWRPLELKQFLEGHSFRTLEMAACEGIATHLREQVNRLDREKWERLVELIMDTSNEPTTIGHSEHFLWIGEKT